MLDVGYFDLHLQDIPKHELQVLLTDRSRIVHTVNVKNTTITLTREFSSYSDDSEDTRKFPTQSWLVIYHLYLPHHYTITILHNCSLDAANVRQKKKKSQHATF